MTAVPLAQVVGRNARQFRLDAGVTLETVAAVARVYGLPWTSGRVGDFEGGRVPPNLATLYAAALALRDVTGQPITIGALLGGEGEVVLNDDLTLPLEVVRKAVSGHPVTTKVDDAGKPIEVVVTQGDATLVIVDAIRMKESDQRLIKDIGAEEDSALKIMLDLWGRPFSEERDNRAGVDANAQRKGQVSRQLKTELVAAIEGGKSKRKGAKRGDS